MILGLGFLDRRKWWPAPQETGAIRPQDYVVARWTKAAPSAWVFFDGTETVVEDRAGKHVLVPGGAFFMDEAKAYADPQEAKMQARRLNALAADANESWVAIAAQRVITGLKGFTPVVDASALRGNVAG